ncbi:MAG: RNA polymerase sigma factor [Clostridiales bacterium]|jgi:RNA polymerase sigma factor (sigma-70 family)|nr:RNA polymerase sigma factor [Clostridiales bacterium]
MNKKMNEELLALVDKATAGDKNALETLIAGVQDIVFNLSLRMLGTFADAEDATQDILLKMITHLSSFRGNSSFTTWVFSIAANHLKNYKKHMFAHYPLSFEYYGNDIENGKIQDVPDLTQNVEKNILAEELKMSCTNVMLQCLNMESRCIFILGTMFKIDSRIAGEILEMTPEAYRQRLSRIRKRMADFLGQYCGEYGSGRCKCKDRVNYAIQIHRLNPLQLDYMTATEISIETMIDVKNAMEDIDDLSQDFSFCKPYQSPERMKHLIREFLDSTQLSIIQKS